MGTHNKIFISHLGKDDVHVQSLKQRLKDKGNNVHNFSIDSTKHRNGRIPSDAVIQRYLRIRVKMSNTIVCLIGQNTHQSKWVNYEIRLAHLYGKRIVGIYTHGSNNSVELPEAYKKYGSPPVSWRSIDKLSDIIDGENFPAEEPDGSIAKPIYPRTKVKC